MSKIKLEVGMRMKCAMYGEGVLKNVSTMIDTFPISFISDLEDLEHQYTYKGQYNIGLIPTLKLLNIPFTEGLEVECDIYGKGLVIAANDAVDLPIVVSFDKGLTEAYTADGRINQYANQTLYPQFTI